MFLFRKNFINCKGNLHRLKINRYHELKRTLCVLGIETSCDDTGLAVVNVNGNVLANVLDSQQNFHTRYGGIIPPRAQDLHRLKINSVFERCMQEAKMKPEHLDAIAVTTRPGLPLSLIVGVRYARYLARKYKKPIIPVHHMEAHALQARMEHDIAYPFLCLLISGGHCQLAFVEGPSNIKLLGETLDDAPGEAFDKIARRLRLYLHPKYELWNGGQAIEDAAKYATNAQTFELPLPLARLRNCNFSFAGIKNNSFRTIRATERQERTPPDGVIRNYADFCADLLKASSRHLMNRTQRALEFCLQHEYFGAKEKPLPRSLVVSGGVANNDFIFADICHLAEQYDCKTFRPSKKYCSDNGVMIAWNAIEQFKAFKENSFVWNYDDIDVFGKIGLGVNIIGQVESANIKCKWIKAKNKK